MAESAPTSAVTESESDEIKELFSEPRAVPGQMQCSDRHATEHMRADSSGACDLCGREITQGTLIHACRPCNWWSCQACAVLVDSLAGVKVNAPVPVADRLRLHGWIHPSTQVPVEIACDRLIFSLGVASSIEDLMEVCEDEIGKVCAEAGTQVAFEVITVWNRKDHTTALSPTAFLRDHFISGDHFGIHGKFLPVDASPESARPGSVALNAGEQRLCKRFRVTGKQRDASWRRAPGNLSQALPGEYIHAVSFKHPPSYSSKDGSERPGWPRLFCGLFVGQTISIAREIYRSAELVAKPGDFATVVGPPEERTKRHCMEKVARIELTSSGDSTGTGRKIDVHLRDVHMGLPGPFKKGEWVVLAKGLHDGQKEITPQYTRAMVWGKSVDRPDSHICVHLLCRSPSELVEVAVADVLPNDQSSFRPSLGSEMSVDVENTESDYEDCRVGTKGTWGIVVAVNKCDRTGLSTHYTIRLKGGKQCTYKLQWLQWHRVYAKHLVSERKEPKDATHSDQLRGAQAKFVQAKRSFDQACAQTFGDELPCAFQVARAQFEETEVMLAACKKSAQTMATRLGQFTQKNAKLREDLKKPWPDSFRRLGRRHHELLVQVAGTGQRKNEAARRKAYEDAVNYTVSWKNGRKPVSQSKHDAGNLDNLRPWSRAKQQAREALGITRFCSFKKGTEEYNKAQEFYQDLKATTAA